MLWDPVPVTLPTYVPKPAARRRTVRTIDLDATGVWTSGNTAGDSQLAREAEQADKAARSRKADDDQRAVGPPGPPPTPSPPAGVNPPTCHFRLGTTGCPSLLSLAERTATTGRRVRPRQK